MQNNKCVTCDGRKARKTCKYCKTCAKEIDNFIPWTIRSHHNNFTRGSYVFIACRSNEGYLEITCDKHEDIIITQAILLEDLRAEIDRPVVFNNHEFTISVDQRFINPVVEKEHEVIYDWHTGEPTNARVVAIDRFKKVLHITMRKLTPEELAQRRQLMQL